MRRVRQEYRDDLPLSVDGLRPTPKASDNGIGAQAGGTVCRVRMVAAA
jgi:hypothetical protein